MKVSSLAGVSPNRPPPMRMLRLLGAASAGLLFWAFVGGFAYSFARYGRAPFGTDPLLGAREAAARRDLPAALRQYEMAQRLSPGEARIAVEHGNLLTSNGRYDEAAGRFLHALQQEPTSAPALAGLADARLGQGRADEAVDLYSRALERAPGHEGLVRALAAARRGAAP